MEDEWENFVTVDENGMFNDIDTTVSKENLNKVVHKISKPEDGKFIRK